MIAIMFYTIGVLLFALFWIFFFLFLLLGLLKCATTCKADLNGKHVVITGGSSGIGKSMACEVAKRGANVTIIARNQDRLDEAKEEIIKSQASQEQKVQTLSMDISGNYEDMKEKLLATENISGPIFMLVNCAGYALCGTLDDITESQIKNQFNVNTIGSILSTKAVLGGMKERKCGHIVLVASQAAYVGIFGFSAYSASKFALRGFAEALNIEVGPYNIKVTVGYPPDTDTPGFAEEEKTKPKETKLISESSGLYHPDQVASQMLDDSLAGRFNSNLGVDGFMLENLCCGMSPPDSYFDFAVQVSSLGLLRCIGAGYNLYFKSIINRCYKEKSKPDKQD